MKFRISQAASIIPIAGYAILWSEDVGGFLTLQERIRDGGWFSVADRIYLIYLGSVILTAALILFWMRCPKFIRRHSTVDEYVLEQGQVMDNAAGNAFVKYMNMLVEKENVQANARYTEKVGILVREYITAEELHSMGNPRVPEARRGSFRVFYLQFDESRFISIGLTAGLMTVGLILLLLPSFEVFYLVMRSLVVK